MKITHKDLNILGEKFLKSSVNWKYKCPITRIELRSAAFETPDVLGLRSGASVLIESKTSRQDFLNDKKKIHRSLDGIGDHRFFLSTEAIIKEEDLYEDWGLLHTDGKKVWVVKHPEHRINRSKVADCFIMYSIIRRQEEELKKTPIYFGDWLSRNYNIENGIGYWSDFTPDDKEYTTNELYKKYINEISNS